MDALKKVFITGGTGFIGSLLVKKLVKNGFHVKVLRRERAAKQEINDKIDYVTGDINNLASVEQGMDGCSYVFHLAAYAKNWAADKRTFAQVNIVGTRNVFKAAIAKKIEKIVYTSSIVTLGCTPRGVVGDESMPRYSPVCFTEYERTKTAVEEETIRWLADGLPLVIVNPTRVFGPDILSESNSVTKLINEYRKGHFPFLLNFGRNIGNYAFADDVAQGHILAMKKGQIGERYILGGDNVSLKELFDTVAAVDGQRRFQFKIFYLVPLLVSYFFEWQANLLGWHPPITSGWVRTFIRDWAFSCDKAKSELGYKPLPFAEAVRKTCEWLDSINETKKERDEEYPDK